MQSFIFLPNGVVWWASSTKTIRDKITDVYRDLKGLPPLPAFCHTSTGHRIAGHQMYYFENDVIVHDNGKTRRAYNQNGSFLAVSEGQNLTWSEIYELEGSDSDVFNQGIEYCDGLIFSAWGNRGHDWIKIKKHSADLKFISEIKYNYFNFEKWYWKNWESEGVRVNPENGKLYAGIVVSTIFGNSLNYIYEVKGLK